MAKKENKEAAGAVDAPVVAESNPVTPPVPSVNIIRAPNEEVGKKIQKILDIRATFAKRIVAIRKELRGIPRNGRIVIEEGKTLVSYVQLDDMLPRVDEILEKNDCMYMTSYEGDHMRFELFDIQSGESLFVSETPLPPYKELADFGRTSTYVRRYLIATVLGISIATDSDALTGALPVDVPRTVTPSVEYKALQEVTPSVIAVEAGLGKKEPEQPSLFKDEVKLTVAEKKVYPPFPERSLTPETENVPTSAVAAPTAPKIEMPVYTNEQRDASALIYAKAAKSIQDSPNVQVLDAFVEKIKDHPKLIESDKQRLMDLIVEKKFNLK